MRAHFSKMRFLNRATSSDVHPSRPRRPSLVLAAAAGAYIIINLDVSAVNLTLDVIRRDLGLSVSQTAWIMNAYALAFGGAIVCGGRVADVIGRRRAFVMGCIFFAATSALVAASPTSSWLISARALQGLGAAVIFPSALAVVANSYSGADRPVALATLSGFGALSQAVGPLVGGALAECASWRWVFVVSVPVALLSAVLAVKLIPESRDSSARGLDWSGAAVLALGLTGVTIGLDEAGTWGWTSGGVVASLLGGLALCALFPAIERFAREPLIAPALLRSRDFISINLAGALFQAVQFTLLVYIPLFMQNVMGYSAIQAALGLLPGMALGGLTGRYAGRLATVIGSRTAMIIALALQALVAVSLALFGETDSGYGLIVGPVIAFGLSFPLFFGPNAAVAVGTVHHSAIGMAAGANFMAKLVGGAIGLAVFTTLFGQGLASPEAFVRNMRLPLFLLAVVAAIGIAVTLLAVREPRASTSLSR